MEIARFISIGSLLTSLTVLLQSAPVLLPVVGLALSPLSTLPIALAAVFNISLGITVLFSSALILIMVSVQEAIILLFTTGILGTVIGTLLYRKGIVVSILSSAIILSIGIIILTYIVGVPAFGDLTGTLSFPFALITFFMFSLIYVSIWNICFRKFANYLIKIGLIK
ncbi:MAG TPA: hypothetical protein VIO64_09790 [Pseudobacteroides sp.]|uniref:hypothetical protein n=1 Tax=Pseudobacteroides sp. TaxID=1968840 RepID=UPI002F941D89